MDLPAANRRLAAGRDLNRAEMQQVMRVIMQGEASPAQIGAFLTALAVKGETVEEITAAARVMRAFAAAVTVDAARIVDCVGTGGDGAKLLNVSTAAALVASAGGAVMAKHGNRAATGNSGSADVLAAAGVDISLTPAQVGTCIARCGIGFMFAPTHHAATRHVVGPRREIGIRTVFNLLGPLTNPAGATHQLVGVFDARWVRPLAEVFGALGSVHTLVVCSEDGLDEISTAAPTRVAEFRGGDGGGEIREYRIAPEDFGIDRAPLEALTVADAAQSLTVIRGALAGGPGPAFDIIALNAGATLYAADVADNLAAGVARAREILKSGEALAKLEQLAQVSTALGKEQ